MKIVYRTDNDLITGWSHKLIDETVYVLKPNELFGDLFKKPIISNNVVVESWTQADTDAVDSEKVKQDKIKEYYSEASTVGVFPTIDGTQHYAIVMGNGGKLITIEII